MDHIFNRGDFVNHVKFPEEYGLGVILELLPDKKYSVEWENEFSEKEILEMDENDLE